MKSRSAISQVLRGGGLALLFSTILSFSALAQGDIDQLTAKSFYFGPKGGINLSNIANDSGPAGLARIGYSGGGFAYYRIIPLVAASVEVQYLQLGSNRHFGISYIDAGEDAGSNILTHNIDIPVLANVYAPVVGNFQPKLLVGPAFTFNLYSENISYQYLNIGPTVFPAVTRENRSSEFNLFETALLVGVGADIPLANLLITADLRYRQGFTNVTDIVNSSSAISEDNNIFRAWQLTVGVGF
ncbi:MAG TPA: hypothetical protein DCE41_07480 [Cytophagales bacterium]|nr:hypothetical protein [Cytophagales bacterium]HAA23029.1 hypothetical protein [Cytophagales bacterium]HAP62074.1 hypothetical protein [Cytophagales bacterium]